MEKPEASDTQDDKAVTLSVKFLRQWIPVELCLSKTVKDLKDLLHPLTNVPPSAQRLINNGRVLRDEWTFLDLEFTHGTMLFLLPIQTPTQGDDPILMEPPITTYSGILQESTMSKTVEEWKATGIIALSLFELNAIPDEVWTCGSSARILDVSYNSLEEVPDKIGSFTILQELNLSANGFQDGSICWEGVAMLKSLTILNLNHNLLTSLPSDICTLTSLRQLDISHNSLNSVPPAIGLLTCLEIFRASNNRISYVSPCMGSCTSLVEVNLALNLLYEVPATFGELKDLKVLSLSNNQHLKTLPSTLFKSCPQLIKLDLQYTGVSSELLRQYKGWEEFDERHCLKQLKQLDLYSTSSPKSDEGADKK